MGIQLINFMGKTCFDIVQLSELLLCLFRFEEKFWVRKNKVVNPVSLCFLLSSHLFSNVMKNSCKGFHWVILVKHVFSRWSWCSCWCLSQLWLDRLHSSQIIRFRGSLLLASPKWRKESVKPRWLSLHGHGLRNLLIHFVFIYNRFVLCKHFVGFLHCSL